MNNLKEHLLSQLEYFNDIEFKVQKNKINENLYIYNYSIKSLNNIKLNIPWVISYDFSRFNIENIEDMYGKYKIIKGKISFPYTISSNKYRKKVSHGRGSFQIGFINCSKLIIFKKENFNQALYIEDNISLEDKVFIQDFDTIRTIIIGDPYRIL